MIDLIDFFDHILGKSLPDWKRFAKLSLSMVDISSGVKKIDEILLNGLHDTGVEYSYWSQFQGKNNFKVGDIVLGFVQMHRRDLWLFTTAGVIDEVPKDPGICKWTEFDDLSELRGRLVGKFDKGNTYSRYVFNLENFISKRKMSLYEVMPKDCLDSVSFPGYDWCSWDFPTLLKILDGGKRFEQISSRLSEIKGIYLLKDMKTGKEYYGSAYGQNGVAQRWQCYLDTSTGGNKELVKLYETLGEDYFKENFVFTLIEHFDMKTSDKTVIDRESWHKKIHMSREFGYNKN